jgi:catechol 2,3-dioxygenase-like lactoylglutathione lyase family enzyme
MGIADWMTTVPGLEDIEELAFPEDFDGTEEVRPTPDGRSPQPQANQGSDDARSRAAEEPPAGTTGAAPDGRLMHGGFPGIPAAWGDEWDLGGEA